MTHVLGSESKLEVLEQFDAGFASEKLGTASPAQFMKDLICTILESKLEKDLTKVA
jgi:hypothetical protein